MPIAFGVPTALFAGRFRKPLKIEGMMAARNSADAANA